MSVTIKDIMLNKDVLFKLVQNKWDSPKKSYEVYRFYMEIESHIAFLKENVQNWLGRWENLAEKKDTKSNQRTNPNTTKR